MRRQIVQGFCDNFPSSVRLDYETVFINTYMIQSFAQLVLVYRTSSISGSKVSAYCLVDYPTEKAKENSVALLSRKSLSIYSDSLESV